MRPSSGASLEYCCTRRCGPSSATANGARCAKAVHITPLQSPLGLRCSCGPPHPKLPVHGRHVPLLMSPAGARARAAQRYGVALGSALLALAAHMLLHRQFGPSLDPLLVLIVGASAWYGGFGPGLATLALVAGGTLFVGAAGTGAANGTQRSELLWLVVYGLSGLVLSALIAWLRAAQRYADRAREQVA